MRLQVRSLASLNGSRICHCHELWCRSQMWLGSGVAVAVGVGRQLQLRSAPTWELAPKGVFVKLAFCINMDHHKFQSY